MPGAGAPQLLCIWLSCYRAGVLGPHPLGSHWPSGHSDGTFSPLCRYRRKYDLEDKHSQMTVARDTVMLQTTQEVMTSL